MFVIVKWMKFKNLLCYFVCMEDDYIVVYLLSKYVVMWKFLIVGGEKNKY